VFFCLDYSFADPRDAVFFCLDYSVNQSTVLLCVFLHRLTSKLELRGKRTVSYFRVWGKGGGVSEPVIVKGWPGEEARAA